MRSKNIAIVALIVLVLALVLNPSPDRHREKIRTDIAERNPIAGVLGVGALTAFASGYHSLGVASYTKFDDRIGSIGFMGMVFVL
jgi:hypothetical protein